jgi:arabinogalactan endo-1,4-beta-galactosidase
MLMKITGDFALEGYFYELKKFQLMPVDRFKTWKTQYFSLVLFMCGLMACHKKEVAPVPEPNPPASGFVFAKGADISWLTEMEASGVKFYNPVGNQKDCMAILKEMGMNTVRLRVWVDPQAGWNNKADVIAKAVRAKNMGMRIMIDFHYSDTWADPGKQGKPAAWANLSVPDLQVAIETHTTSVLNALKAQGIEPAWVQVGNETNDGMLWPEGRASTNMKTFAKFIASGYRAVKAVFPNAKVIVHLSDGFNNTMYRWLFDGLKNNGATWDVIGMSLYPQPSNWTMLNMQCLDNMEDMVSRYQTEVMVVEVGMSWDQEASCRSFLEDIISKTKSLPGNKGLGVLYWEPEAFANWNGYTLGAFDNRGVPTTALNAFHN